LENLNNSNKFTNIIIYVLPPLPSGYPGRQMRAIQHRNIRDRVHLSAEGNQLLLSKPERRSAGGTPKLKPNAFLKATTALFRATHSFK
jgi:hypothetical protein